MQHNKPPLGCRESGAGDGTLNKGCTSPGSSLPHDIWTDARRSAPFRLVAVRPALITHACVAQLQASSMGPTEESDSLPLVHPSAASRHPACASAIHVGAFSITYKWTAAAGSHILRTRYGTYYAWCVQAPRGLQWQPPELLRVCAAIAGIRAHHSWLCGSVSKCAEAPPSLLAPSHAPSMVRPTLQVGALYIASFQISICSCLYTKRLRLKLCSPEGFLYMR